MKKKIIKRQNKIKSSTRMKWFDPVKLIQNNWQLILAIILAFSICASIRLIDLKLWSSPHLKIDGEIILSDNDSYAWMAGAKKLNFHSEKPLAILLRTIHSLTGLKFSVIAFWLPAILAPLVVIPICFLMSLWGIPEGGVLAGIMTGACSGYLTRTRLGIFDTDILTLFFPVLLATFLAILMESRMKDPWGEDRFTSSGKMLLMAFITGIIYRLYLIFYISSSPVALSIIGIAFIIALIFARNGSRVEIISSILIILVVGGGNFFSILICLIIIFVLFIKTELFNNTNSKLIIFLILITLFYFNTNLTKRFRYIKWSVSRYTKTTIKKPVIPKKNIIKTSKFRLPDTMKSINEAKIISFDKMVYQVSQSWLIFISGLLGYMYLIWRKPSVLFFLPMILLGILSYKFGLRFSMYGGIGIGIGFGGLTAFAVKENGYGKLGRWSIQFFLCILVLYPTINTVRQYKLPQFIPKIMGNALIETKKITSDDSHLWLWWDFGYVAQYFTERTTVADGLRNIGHFIYPLARIYATDSPVLAYKIMSHGAYGLQKKSEKKNSINSRNVRFTNPLSMIYKQNNKFKYDFFNKKENINFPSIKNSNDHYLILTWENLKKLDWIMKFGTWDLKKDTGNLYNSILIHGKMNLDVNNGRLKINKNEFEFIKALVIDKKGSKLYNYKNLNGKYALVNNIIGEVYLMEEKVFNSLMVQMLVSNPERFKPYYEIVIDWFPWFRLYKLSKNLGDN